MAIGHTKPGTEGTMVRDVLKEMIERELTVEHDAERPDAGFSDGPVQRSPAFSDGPVFQRGASFSDGPPRHPAAP